MRRSLSYLLAMVLGGVIVGSILFAVRASAQGGADLVDDPPTLVDATLDWQIQNIFQYQGQLLNAQSVAVNGIQQMTFRLYDQPAGGNLLWQQTKSVSVQNGWFSTVLGDEQSPIADSVLDGRNLYLGVQITGDTAEMNPRQPIRPTLFAANAKLLAGLPYDYFLAARRGPIAYGVVKADGGRESGWHFTSANKPKTGEYQIQLHDDNNAPLRYDAALYTTVVTPMAGNNICNARPSVAMTNSTNDGRLIVFIQGLDGEFKDCPFHFITIQNKPDGTE